MTGSFEKRVGKIKFLESHITTHELIGIEMITYGAGALAPVLWRG
jgi:hypothetical protein